jgi:hypothetical protein
MTKQEIAEFMAEKVLGWEVSFLLPKAPTWSNPMGGFIGTIGTVVDFIYSPEGLIAIVKALPKPIKFKLDTLNIWVAFLFDLDYDNFYNAVMEVWG